MTSKEISEIKKRIENTLKKRNGMGSVNNFTGESYAIPEIKKGEPITSEIGQKTIDLLLRITGDDAARKNYPELGSGTYSGGAIPEAFNINDINRICDELDKDTEDTTSRGGFKGYINGVYHDLPGGIDGRPGDSNKTEVNHCGGACTGICVGSCVDMCNGCVGCYGSCEGTCTGEAEIASTAVFTEAERVDGDVIRRELIENMWR